MSSSGNSEGLNVQNVFTLRPNNDKFLVVKLKKGQYMHTLVVPVFETEEL